jgi:hypothetical protein
MATLVYPPDALTDPWGSLDYPSTPITPTVPQSIPEYPRVSPPALPSLVRTSVGAHQDVIEVGGAVGAADDVDGAGGVDHGRVPLSRSPGRARRTTPPSRTCRHAREPTDDTNDNRHGLGEGQHSGEANRPTHVGTIPRTLTATPSRSRTRTEPNGARMQLIARGVPPRPVGARVGARVGGRDGGGVATADQSHTHARSHGCSRTESGEG